MSSNAIPSFNQHVDLQQFIVERRPVHLYYTKLHRKFLLISSIFNFFLWTLSTALQVFGIALANGITYYRRRDYSSTSTSLSHNLYYNNGDSASLGIWCAIFYMLTAFLGYSSSYTPTRKLLISTLVFSTFSLLGALMTGTVAGLSSAFNCISVSFTITHSNSYHSSENYCYDWRSIENSLVVVSFLAGVNSIVVIVLVSMALKSGPHSMTENDYAALSYRHQHFDHRREQAPIIMVTNPTPLIQYPCQVVYQPTYQQPQQPQQLQPVLQPKPC